MLFWACGTETDPGVKKNGDNANATDGLAGTWTGNFLPKGADEGSSLREKTSAEVEFAEDEKRAGTFTITLPRLDKVFTKGIYTDFGDSIMLQVKESSNSLIGLPGSTPELKYEMLGSGLRLYNERVSLVLARDYGASDGDGGGAGGDGQDEEGGLIGTWSCQDAGADWQIIVKSAAEFSIKVSSANQRASWQRGSIEMVDGQKNLDAKLTVVASLNANYDGIVYEVDLKSKDMLMLKPTKFGSVLRAAFQCAKQ